MTDDRYATPFGPFRQITRHSSPDAKRWLLRRGHWAACGGPYPAEEWIDSYFHIIEEGELSKAFARGESDDELIEAAFVLFRAAIPFVFTHADSGDGRGVKNSLDALDLFVCTLQDRDITLNQLDDLASIHWDMFSTWFPDGRSDEWFWNEEQDRSMSARIRAVFDAPANREKLDGPLADYDHPSCRQAMQISSSITGADEFEMVFKAAIARPRSVRWLAELGDVYQSPDQAKRVLDWGRDRLELDSSGFIASRVFKEGDAAAIALLETLVGVVRKRSLYEADILLAALRASHSGPRSSAAHVMAGWDIAHWPTGTAELLRQVLEVETWPGTRDRLAAALELWERRERR